MNAQVFFIVFIVMMTIFIIIQTRQEKKENAKIQLFQDKLDKGLKVITSAGIIGNVEKIDRTKSEATIISGTARFVCLISTLRPYNEELLKKLTKDADNKNDKNADKNKDTENKDTENQDDADIDAQVDKETNSNLSKKDKKRIQNK
jgi:preprotein translocase YajC subunit